MCRFFAYCLHSHNSVSFIPLKYVKFNLPCKYLPRGMNAKHDVIYTSGYVCSLAVILIMVILKRLRVERLTSPTLPLKKLKQSPVFL